MEKVSIRGVAVMTAPNQTEFAEWLMNEHGIQHGMLVAINAEKVILADEMHDLAELLAQAEFPYADGISVVKAIQQKYPQYRQLERIAGADLWLVLMQRAQQLELPVFLVGATAEVLAQTRAKLQAMGVKIVGYQDGYVENEEMLIEHIRQSGAKFVSVALGSPKQEHFIYRAKQTYPNCLYMGVGGTYDVFVGKVKRAPKAWQNLGLEWLYRLLHQPTRWRRQLRLGKFAWYFFTKGL